MNRNEKLGALLLGLLLVGYLVWQWAAPKPAAQPVVAQAPAPVVQPVVAEMRPVEPAAQPEVPVQQAFQTLENGQVRLTFSDLGGRLVRAELLQYKAENAADAKNVVLETGDLLNLAWQDLPAVPMACSVVDAKTLVFRGVVKGAAFERTVVLEDDYALTVRDAFTAPTAMTLPEYTLSVGSFRLSEEEGDLLSIDTLARGERKPQYREGELGKVLGAGSAFLGCGTSSDATGLPVSATEKVDGAQAWMALKSRFFTTLVAPEVAAPATLSVARDPQQKTLTVTSVGGSFAMAAQPLQPGVRAESVTRLYVGPKELSSLKAFGAQAERIMDFGMFSWVCGPLLQILNLCHGLIPNYGIAIILLTLLVRVVFWPLTHKSTISMRKMSVIQPQIKELQKKFKDQPQKIQQETFKLYREHKVNPFSSCLPMLIQIPIFIALFTVLRSAVELRFASFLWIADLSQPENLFAGFLPMPLNILPILTAVTMALQTHLTPSTGDPAQKKMMTWMMPIMLLFMFYSMPSALCLYWTVSQVLSIAQMWHIQRSTRATA